MKRISSLPVGNLAKSNSSGYQLSWPLPLSVALKPNYQRIQLFLVTKKPSGSYFNKCTLFFQLKNLNCAKLAWASRLNIWKAQRVMEGFGSRGIPGWVGWAGSERTWSCVRKMRSQIISAGSHGHLLWWLSWRCSDMQIKWTSPS